MCKRHFSAKYTAIQVLTHLPNFHRKIKCALQKEKNRRTLKLFAHLGNGEYFLSSVKKKKKKKKIFCVSEI